MKYNTWGNLKFLAGISGNVYKVKIDKLDFWRYIGSLILLTLVQIPRIILAIPLVMLFFLLGAFSGITAVITYLYEKLLAFMKWLPLPIEFHDRFAATMSAKYRLRIPENVVSHPGAQSDVG